MASYPVWKFQIPNMKRQSLILCSSRNKLENVGRAAKYSGPFNVSDVGE